MTNGIETSRSDYLWHSIAELGHCACIGDRILWKKELARLCEHLKIAGDERVQFTPEERTEWDAILKAARQERNPFWLQRHLGAIVRFWNTYMGIPA